MPAIPLPTGSYLYKEVTGADPAANTEASLTVPASKFWWLLSVRVQLVQGITQTPLPFLVLDDGTTAFYEAPGSTAAQAVSTTCTYTWAPDVQVTGQIGATPTIRSMGPLPSLLLLGPGFRIRTATQGIGANSDYGVPVAYVIEFS
jgi:hypothetical protein